MAGFALGTGQESYIGLGEETTYGTRATLTDYLRFVTENLKHDTNLLTTAASLGDPMPYSPVRTGVMTSGNIVFEPWINGLELVLKYALGDHFTTTNPTTGVYSHKFRLGRYLPSYKSVIDPSFTSLTADVYRGSQATGYVWGYAGMLLDGMRLEFSAGQTGRLTVGAKFYDSCIVASPSAVTVSCNRLPIPTHISVGIADPTTAAAAGYTDVTAFNFSLTVPQGLAQEFPLGLNGGTNYPLPLAPHRDQNKIKVAGSFTCLAGIQTRTYGSKTLEALMSQNLACFLRVTADASEVILGQLLGHTIELQNVHITGATPDVGDPGNIKRTVTFEAYAPLATYDVSQFPNLMQWTVTGTRSSFGGR